MPELNDQSHPEKAATRAAAGRFCVLVTSSDRARDIFEIVFQNAETIWADCDWPRYVGFTSKHPDMYGFTALAAKRPSDWRGELGDQLDSLPEEIQYVTLIIEDFLFTSPVKRSELNAIAYMMIRDDLCYVRLSPVVRNYLGLVLEYFRRKFDRRPLRPLRFSEPYYSSVEVAIWKRDYLRSLLRQPGSIWEFENTVSTNRHYAVWNRVVNYRPLVGRGKWYSEASQLLARLGVTLSNSKRESQTLGLFLRRIQQRITFQVIGYMGYRLRRRLNRLPRS